MPCGFPRAVFIGFWVTILELWSCVVGLNSNSSVLDNFGSENSLQSSHCSNGSQGVHLASWNFDCVSPAYVITVFVLLAGLVKIGFHHMPRLSAVIPESCVLIIIGTAVGGILYAIGKEDSLKLETKTFMLFLLPPIVLEASYSLNNKAFADNIFSILIFAILGTTLNFLIIGFSMYGLGQSGLMGDLGRKLRVEEYLLFGSFIVAVDPVAVLAIFQDIGVNQVLYFLVFGESLLNDAVTIVLYNMMKAFTASPEIGVNEILIGIGSFFTVSLGGLLIGIIFGIVTCLVTRVTSHVRVTEPLAILGLAYLAYLSAELFHWSGIISCIGCGIIQAHYAFENISEKSSITVQYFIKMLSSTNDSIIFLFLGVELIRTSITVTPNWNTGFIISALVLCLLARIVSVFGLSFIINFAHIGKSRINLSEQFIMWYGGLRGAVCFALCDSIAIGIISENERQLFLITTFVIILFTVFIQGITIKPLVNVCKIVKKTDEEDELLIELQNLVMKTIQANIDMILGLTNNRFHKLFHQLNEKYLKKVLLKKTLTDQDRFIETYRRIALDRYRSVLLHGTIEPITPPPGIMTDGIFITNMDAFNEEALAAEVTNELHASRNDVRQFSRRNSGTELSRGQMYRILSKASLGNPWLHDRDLRHHDIVISQDPAVVLSRAREEFARSLWDINEGRISVADSYYSQAAADRAFRHLQNNRSSVNSVNSDFPRARPSAFSINSDPLNHHGRISNASSVSRRPSTVSYEQDAQTLQHTTSAMCLTDAQRLNAMIASGATKHKAMHGRKPKRTTSLKEQQASNSFQLRFVPGRLRKNSGNLDSVKRLTTLGEEQSEERDATDSSSPQTSPDDDADLSELGAYSNAALEYDEGIEDYERPEDTVSDILDYGDSGESGDSGDNEDIRDSGVVTFTEL